MEFRTKPDSTGTYVYLKRKAWDDQGFDTTFDAFLFDHRNGRASAHLGTVKILQRGRMRTELPEAFTALSDEFCSLGQSRRYDLKIADAGDIGCDVLSALRDVRVLSPEERARYVAEPGFEKSLLRFAQARFLYSTTIGTLPRNLRVRVRVSLPGFDAPHDMTLDLDPERILGRVAVIVGENGTGKTRLLDAMARALSGVETKWIAEGEPTISRVIALSCNAFDQFMIPIPLIEDSYFYVGLRSREVSSTSITRLPRSLGG